MEMYIEINHIFMPANSLCSAAHGSSSKFDFQALLFKE